MTEQSMRDWLQLRGCTCANYPDDRCGCQVCQDRALTLHACPHRLERLLDGQARNDRLYDGLCDACFELSRAVCDCGQRVAEHS